MEGISEGAGSAGKTESSGSTTSSESSLIEATWLSSVCTSEQGSFGPSIGDILFRSPFCSLLQARKLVLLAAIGYLAYLIFYGWLVATVAPQNLLKG